MIVVVGAGPAGLSAARLLAGAGREVVVLDRADKVGGRTRSVELMAGHRVGLGAAWIPSFYERTLRLCEGLELVELPVRTTPELIIDGGRVPAPFSATVAARTAILPPMERLRLAAWSLRLMAIRVGRPGRALPLRYDDIDADAYIRRAIGPAAAEYVFRPAAEPRAFAELSEFSASLVRSWAKASIRAKFFAPAGGMDAPWQRIAAGLDVRTGITVTRVQPGAVEPFGEVEAAVVAVPAPEVARLVPVGTPGRPDWLEDIRYAPHVGAFAERRSDRAITSQVHPAGPGHHRVSGVSITSGGTPWLPAGWERAFVGARSCWAQELLEAHPDDDSAVLSELWAEGTKFEPRLFPLEEAEVTLVRRQPHAVPVFAPGHARRLARWQRDRRVALAGDWAVDPSVEGAIRSGERAAQAVLDNH